MKNCMYFAWANADEIIIDLSGVILTASMTRAHELRIAREYNLIRDVFQAYNNSTEILSSCSTTTVLDILTFSRHRL